MKVSSKPFKEGDAWIARRGCLTEACKKDKKGCKWHGEFASCSSDPNSKHQRKAVLKAAWRFQKERVDRVDTLMGYTRRRVGGSSGRVYDSKPVGQVMLSVDAALRKAIARVRQSTCAGDIPTDPKERKTCTVKELKTSNNNKQGKAVQIISLWKTFMKRDHGVVLGHTMGDGGMSKRLDEQVGLVDKVMMNHAADGGMSAIFTIKYKTTDGQKEGCEIRSGWKFNFYMNCKCSPFAYVEANVYKDMITPTLKCLAGK